MTAKRICFVFEQTLTIDHTEDNGEGLIGEFPNSVPHDPALWVWLVSSDDSKEHQAMRALVGRRMRITVETVGEDEE